MSNRNFFWIDELARHWRLTLWQHRCLINVGRLDDGSLGDAARKLRERWLATPDGDAEWMPGNREKLYSNLRLLADRTDDKFHGLLTNLKGGIPAFRTLISERHVANAESGWESGPLQDNLSHCLKGPSSPTASAAPQQVKPANYAIPADIAAQNWIRMSMRLLEWREFTQRLQRAENFHRVARELGDLTHSLDLYYQTIKGSQQRSVLGEFLTPGKRELQVIIGDSCDLIRNCANVFRELLNRLPTWAQDLQFDDSIGLFRHADEELDGPPKAILEFMDKLRPSGAEAPIHEFLRACLSDEQPEQCFRDIGPDVGVALDGDAQSRLVLLRRLVDGVTAQLDGDHRRGAETSLLWLWKDRLISGRNEVPKLGLTLDLLSHDNGDDVREVAYDAPSRLLAARMWFEKRANGVIQRVLLRPACVEVPRKVAPLVVPLRQCADLCQTYDSRLSELCRGLASELTVGVALRDWLAGSPVHAESRQEHLWQLATRLELNLTVAHEQIQHGQSRRTGREAVGTSTTDVERRYKCLEQVSDELAKEGVEWVNTSNGAIRGAQGPAELCVAPDALAASAKARRMIHMPGATLRLPDGHERPSVVWCRLAQSDHSASHRSLLALCRDEEFFARLRRADATWSGWSEVDLHLSSLTLDSSGSAETGAAECLFELFYRHYLDAREGLRNSYRTAAATIMRHLVELRAGRPICPPLDIATLAPLPPEGADASLVDTIWVVDTSPAGTPLRVDAFQFDARRGRLVRSLGPQPLPEVKAWFELPPFPSSWASASIQGQFEALKRAFETAAAASHASVLGSGLPKWKQWLATPDGEEWLNLAITAARRARQAASQSGASPPTLSDEATWIDFFMRWNLWACYPEYDPRQDVVAWPNNQTTIGTALSWDFDDDAPLGRSLPGRPVRFATRPESAKGTFSLGRKGVNKALGVSWLLLQWSRDHRQTIPNTCEGMAKLGQAIRDRELLAAGGGESSSDKLIEDDLKQALSWLSTEPAAGDQSPRDEALQHLREAARIFDWEILPTVWSFVSPPSVSDIKQVSPDARFEFRFSTTGRKAGHIFCTFTLQRRRQSRDHAAKTSSVLYSVSGGPLPDGWRELQATIDGLPLALREIVKPSIADWPRAAAENQGDPVYAVERFVTKLWDEGQLRIAEARFDLTHLTTDVNRVLRVFQLELYRPERLDEFSDWRSFVEVEGALGDSRRISRVYRPGLRRINGHECRLRARVLTE